ncbi:MAG TPA: hypothetical protein VM554_15280 [Acidisarcina sp.]|nr:hypothetical protein [Acidisarcina sp.]
MSASRKKAILRKLSRDWVAGYLEPTGFVSGGKLELLDLSGKVASYDLKDLKWVCFVRDFNSGELNNPERLLRKNFPARPRSEGLWLRLRLQDGDLIEGLAANDVSLIEQEGLFLTPPDTRSNTQRIFVPRSSVVEFEVLAVIGAAKRKGAAPEQETLFPQNLSA